MKATCVSENTAQTVEYSFHRWLNGNGTCYIEQRSVAPVNRALITYSSI